MEMILRFFSNGINSVLDMADLVLVSIINMACIYSMIIYEHTRNINCA